MADKFEAPIEFDLEGNPGPIRFETPDELFEWAEAERSHWAKLLEPRRGQHPFSVIVTQQLSGSAKVSDFAKRAQEAAHADAEWPKDPDLTDGMRRYMMRHCLHRTSPGGELVSKKLADPTNDGAVTEAVGMLAPFIQVAIPSKNIGNHSFDLGAWLTGITRGVVAQEYRPDWIEALETSLADKIRGWDTELAEMRRRHDEATRMAEKTRARETNAASTRSNEFNEQKTNFEERIAEIEKLYGEKVRTEAPVNYWTERAEKHERAASNALTFFVLGAFVAAGLGGIAGYYLFPLESFGPDSGWSLLARASLLVLPAFFAVWVLRIILRSHIHNQALAYDARERVAMIQTFRSLLEHEGRVDEADRILMLQALFRPAASARDDDAAPPNWFDVMMRRMGK